jgi:uncharacterized double-CXXCG motif protein
MPESSSTSLALMDTRSTPTVDPGASVFTLENGEPPDAAWDDYHANVKRSFFLPGVKCPECGRTWARTGMGLPGADVPEALRKPLSDPWPVPLSVFEERRRVLSEWLPSAAGLPPGSELGPLAGRVFGRVPEFLWVAPWILILREDVVAELHRRGVALSAHPSQVTARRYSGVLYEPELPCVADAVIEDRQPPCLRCGWTGVRVPERLELIGASVVGAGDLFRGRELTTLIFATRRLRDIALECGWRGVTFTPVPTR